MEIDGFRMKLKRSPQRRQFVVVSCGQSGLAIRLFFLPSAGSALPQQSLLGRSNYDSLSAT